MANSVFMALNGQNQPNIQQNFIQFMNQMRGKNPNQIINELVSSGQISQEQLNEAQQRAQQMAYSLQSLRGMFGK